VQPTLPPPPAVARARRRLLRFYDHDGRDLPWRRTTDPYAIWISEVMLQQTRVEAVIAHYERFLKRFPTLADLASAELEEVLAAWTGLGYYRRARLLHAGARFVADEHDGRLPSSREQLQAIPGVGAYTAGAVASIAFGRAEPAVDANVARVVARVFAGGGDQGSRAPSRMQIEQHAAALARCRRAGDVNQALMDLGARICRAKRPRCQECPLQPLCGAWQTGVQEQIPPPRPRKPARDVHLACAVVRSGRRALLVRRDRDRALLGGMWELPTVEQAAAADARRLLEDLVDGALGRRASLSGPCARVRHDIVGRRIVADVYVAEVDAGAPRAQRPSGAARGVEFFSEEEMKRAALSALPLKILRATGFPGRPQSSASRAEART